METRKDAFDVAAQRPVHQGSSGSTVPTSRLPEPTNSSSIRPVNYSIQTGEEFALEFMRDRSTSKKNLMPDTPSDKNTTYKDLRGILSGSDSMTKDSQKVVQLARKDPSEIENKSHHLSQQTSGKSFPRSSSGEGSSRGAHSYSSESSDTSRKIKFLCSFGGKILPRPSDGNLRYVGGETHIVRLGRSVSWQELKRKMLTIYNQPHTIKYQLPGEDLDALISVSSDEDLRNMMEEYGLHDGNNTTDKIRIFLFSNTEFNDISLSLGSMDGDSEIQYVVAVNGMDIGSGKSSSGNGLVNISNEEFGQFINLNVDFQQADASICMQELQELHSTTSVLPSNSSPGDYVMNMPTEQCVAQAHYSYVPASDRSSLPIPLPLLFEYDNTSQSTSYVGHPHVLSSDRNLFNDGAAEGLGLLANENMVPENNQYKKKEIDYLYSLKNLKTPIGYDASSVDATHVKVSSAASPQDSLVVLGVTDEHMKDSDAAALSMDILVKSPEFNGDDRHAGVTFSSGPSDHEADVSDLAPSKLPLSGRVYFSERIPREQAELNRLSKSDDTLGSQLLLLPTQSVLEKQYITDAISQTISEPSKSACPFDDGQAQLDTNRTPPYGFTESDQFVVSSHPEGSDSKKLSELPALDEQLSMADERNMNETYATHSEKVVQADDNGVMLGSSEELSTNDGSSFPWAGSSVISHPQEVYPVSNVPNSRICVDSNPPDILDELFTKAKMDAQLAAVSHFIKDDGALSLNLPTHEPQRWSLFRKLAQDQFERKDVMIEGDLLMNQGEVSVDQFSGLLSDVAGMGQMPNYNAFNVPLPQETSTSNIEDRNIFNPGLVSPNVGHLHVMENSPEEFQFGDAFPIGGVNLKPIISQLEELIDTRTTAGMAADSSVRDIDIDESVQIIKNDDLEELTELGSGTFGTVYHGKWRGTDVAIKRIKKSYFTGRSSEQERLTTEFWREAEILSKLHHPNVVAFYGVVKDGPGGTLATVTEFMVNGSLRLVLQRKEKVLDRRKRLILAMDAAFGMEYLHSKNIVHFDLKCDNLLVNLKDPSRPICKVADFGLSKIRKNTLVSGGVRGTLPWMAPELLNGGSNNKVSEKVDVFSFGIVMWEILTGEEPYTNMHYGAIIGGIVSNTLRPPVPNDCDPEWRMLMEQCWAPDPTHRPSFTEIAGRLRTMWAAGQAKAAK